MTHAPTPPPRSPRGVAPAFTGNVPPLPYREPLAQETFQVANIDDITKFGLTEQQLSLNALQQSNFLFHQLNLISTQLAQLAAETTALRARAAHPSAELRAEIEKLESKARFYESQEELIQNQLMGIKQVIASATSNPQGTVLLNKPKYHQAKTNFTSHHRLQLSYQLGDVITVLDQFPTGWWKGELHGTKGFFQVANTTPLSDINLDEIELNPFPVATPISPRPTHTEPAGGIPPIPSRPVPQPVSDPEIPLAPVREAPPPPAPVARYEPKPTPAAHHEPVKITPVQVPVLAVPQPTANANPVSPRTNPVSPRSNPLSPRGQTPTRPLPNPVPNRALPATPPHSNPAVNNQPPPEPPAKPLPTPPTSKPLYDVSSPQPSKLYDSPAAPVSTPVPPQKPSNLYDYSAPSQPTKPAAASSLYSYSTPEPAPAPVPPAKPADIAPAPTPPPKQQEPAPAPVPPVKPAEVVNAPAPTPPPKQQEVVTPVVHHEPQARPVSVYQNLPVAKVLYSFPKSKQNELAVTKGEIVYVVKDTGVWTLVRNEAGDRGYVPSNYLQK